MTIAVCVLSVAFIITLTKYILYRRQVRDICRQLAFIRENQSDIRIRLDINSREFVDLTESLNKLNDELKKLDIYYKDKDKKLKDALSNVSHDIRTPLTSLKGYFELVSKEEDAEKRAGYEQIIKERIDTLSELLEELFTFTRLQDEAYQVELSEIDMTKPVLDTLFSFYEEIQSTVEEPSIDICEDKIMVMGNEIAIKRLAGNLIKNALVHGDGELKIVYGNDKDSEECVVFSVANSVKNPSEIDVSQVFDRFYKADKARSKSSTGLGLAIAKQYAERMGGEIKATLVDNEFKIEVKFSGKRK